MYNMHAMGSCDSKHGLKLLMSYFKPYLDSQLLAQLKPQIVRCQKLFILQNKLYYLRYILYLTL